MIEIIINAATPTMEPPINEPRSYITEKRIEQK